MITNLENTIQKRIIRNSGLQQADEIDILAIEEPLEIRVSFFQNGSLSTVGISVTMRTPGDDDSLALGFLYTEGILDKFNNVRSIEFPQENIVCINLNDSVEFDLKNLQRNFYTTSSCGVCGKASIEAIHVLNKHVAAKKEIKINRSVICKSPSILLESQRTFEKTGGLHASAILDIKGKLILLKEDVGRHNALDKVIGTAFQSNLLPFDEHFLLLSGRASFELVQKAILAGIQVIAAIGAPSSLAVELAETNNITLIGFLRNDRFNIYCGGNRIIPD
jgi:FdhD protein